MDLTGKTVLITGAAGGIGGVTAERCAEAGARIVAADVDEAGAEATADRIEDAGGDATSHRLDVRDREAFASLVEAVDEEYDGLDALVNNAGVYPSRRSETEDGYEATFAVNHLAPHLLTRELLDLVVGCDGRVVVTSSGLHRRGELRFDDLFRERDYDARGAYAASKLANALFVHELDRRFEAAGSDARALNADPGFVPSTALSRSGSLRGRAVIGLLDRLPVPFANDLETGASSLVRCVADPGVDSGAYVTPEGATAAAERARDDGAARRLWDVSSGLVGVSPDGWV